MTVILWAFTVFHFCVGLASLGLAIRLLTPGERAHWRSQSALLAAEFLCWIYPVVAVASVKSAWGAYASDHHLAMPILLTPIAWLLFMGVIFAVVDFLEDGVLGNARRG
ncbi:MAG: hypothetical protein ABL883_03895 [Terricaulis sp.]